MTVRIVEALITPPGLCLLMAVIGWWLHRSTRPGQRRLGKVILIAGAVLLWLAATPLVATGLVRSLQVYPALAATGPLPDAQAIVVLSAEADRVSMEYGDPSPGAMTLQRIRYAAALHQRTRLPVLTSGGRPGTEIEPLATSMARTLERELATPVRWREQQSADTWENAKFSAEQLKADGIQRILLVTHAWHLPRAVRCFRAQGLEVVPAPTAFKNPSDGSISSFLPSAYALRDTALASHECIGAVWYWLLGRGD